MTSIIMNRCPGVVCATVLVCGAAVAPAMAQTPAPEPASAQAQAPAAAPAAQPKPARAWHGSLNAGFAVASGVQAQRGYQLSTSLQRQIAEAGHFVANLSHQYERQTFPHEALLSDRTSASVGVDINPTKHTLLMGRSMYLRDKLMYVNSRFEQLVGYGLHLYDEKKRFDFQFVPGVSIFKQDLAYSDILDWETGWGFFQKFTGHITPQWSVSNSFRFRDNFKDVDRSIEAIASMQGMFTKTLGVQLEYQWNHESIVPPGFPQYLSVVSVGLRFQF